MSGVRERCVARRWVRGVAVLAGLLPLLAATPVNIMRAVTLQSTPAPADAVAHPYCAVLDADVFSEAAPGLSGLHLLQGGVEIPFVTTVSEPESAVTDAARILRLQEEDGALSFDLGMPSRAYTAIVFKLRIEDFVAVAEISAASRVGEYKLFDLSREHLERQTTVQLPEMRESVLHVTLRAQGRALRADDLEGVDVLPDRAGQSLYTAVVETASFANTAHETIAEFDVPAHVPVQRIRFETKSANFRRRVRVEAWPADDAEDIETISGEITSTHRSQNGEALEDTQLVVPMTLGANLQVPAHVRVIVENDDNEALALTGVVLEMREHKLCFDAKSGAQVELAESGDGAVASVVPALAQQSWEGTGVAVLGAAKEDVASVGFTPLTHCWWSSWPLLYFAGGVLALIAGAVFFVRRRIVRKALG